MKGCLCVLAASWLLMGLPLEASELADARRLVVQGRFQEALSSVDRALAGEPSSPDLKFLRAFVLARAGREDEALQVFSELTREHPEYPEPFNNVAVIYARRGDYERAVEILKQALQTHSSYRTAYENLTRVYGQLASRAYDRALGQESDSASAGPALHLLSDLGDGARTGDGAESRVVVLGPLAAPAPTPNEQTPVGGPGAEMSPSALPQVSETPRATTPRPEAAFDAGELVEIVRGWARAWSEQRPADYLDFYSSRYSPGGGRSRSTWAAQRQERIYRPRFIEVSVESVGVRPLERGRAQVKFVQSYRSDRFQDRVIKTLDMMREGGEWKIVREESLLE